MKIGDLNEVETWTGGAYLGPGTFDVKCIAETHGTSSKGNPQIEFEWESVSGDSAGATIKDWIVVLPTTLGKVKQLMEACGVDIPKGEFDLKEGDFLGLRTRIIVRKDPDRKYPGVAAYTSSDTPLPDESGLHEQASEEPALPF